MATVSVVNSIKLTNVKVGDVFQFIRSAGCRNVGELLVVTKEVDGHLTFAPVRANMANYGDVQWLEDELNGGALKYAGSLASNSLLMSE